MTFGENNSLPTPSQHLGFEVGADRRLAGWGQIVDYFERLDRASDRVKTLEIGRSTEGNPFLLTIISSARNIANLDKYKRIQKRLADPRGIADDAEQVNPNGGAIAIGHPLGMSGARIVLAAARQLGRTGGRYALCTMCVGVGQGTAIIIEKV